MKPHHSGPPQMSFHTGMKIFLLGPSFHAYATPRVLVERLGAMTEGSREVLINLLSPTKSRRRWRISSGQSVHSRYLVLGCVFVDDDQRLRDRGGAHLSACSSSSLPPYSRLSLLPEWARITGIVCAGRCGNAVRWFIAEVSHEEV